jgi:hypothetical protein
MEAHGLITLLALSFLAAIPPAGPLPPAVSVRPAQDRFAGGEPIAVVVKVENPGPLPLEFWFGYPSSFAGEGSPIRFDGGPAMPPRENRKPMGTGPIGVFATEVPAGGSWSATISLQNHLRQPPPGEYPVRYQFRAAYRAKARATPTGPDRPDLPVLSAEGSFPVRITAADPAGLDRLMAGLAARASERRVDEAARLRASGAVEALSAIESASAIPHLVAAIRDIEDDLATIGLFEALARFRGRDEARQAVAKLASSAPVGVASRALEWLGEGGVAVDPAVIAELVDRPVEEGEAGLAHSALLYLRRVPAVRPDEALRRAVLGRVRAESGAGEISQDLALALGVLARWGGPPDATIREALDKVVAALGRERPPDLEDFVAILGAYRLRLAAGVVGGLLDREAGEAIPATPAILAYLKIVGVEGYKGLESKVAALLKSEDVATVLAALDVLEAMGHALSPAEVKELMEGGPTLKRAVEAYLRRRPAA